MYSFWATGCISYMREHGNDNNNQPPPPVDGLRCSRQKEPDLNAHDATENMTASERERLILENMPQVKLIARRIHDRVPSSISLDDLISTGVIGLISAIDRYDASHGVKLKTYAEYKIRGAILDSLAATGLGSAAAAQTCAPDRQPPSASWSRACGASRPKMRSADSSASPQTNIANG